MPTIKELNTRLLEVCTADVIDYEQAEELLKQGAEPLGVVDRYGDSTVYYEILEDLTQDYEVREDFYKITELFIKYGMDISKPAIPYDDSDVLNPLWFLGFSLDGCVLKTLKLLLDNGLSAEDAASCWMHAICDFCLSRDELTDEIDLEMFYDYIRKLMLFASYPHVLQNDERLREEIWLEYNDYDVTKFRQWDDFRFEVDTSHCEDYPEIYKSIVNIFEKSTGKHVWTFGVCLSPEDI